MLGGSPEVPVQKVPELLNSMEETEKAISTVRATTHAICEWLGIGQKNEALGEGSGGNPEPRPTLIGERMKQSGRFRKSLYETNSLLEEILEAIREI